MICTIPHEDACSRALSCCPQPHVTSSVSQGTLLLFQFLTQKPHPSHGRLHTLLSPLEPFLHLSHKDQFLPESRPLLNCHFLVVPCPHVTTPSPLLFSITAPLIVSLMAPSATEVQLRMRALLTPLVPASPPLEHVLIREDPHLCWSHRDTFSQGVMLRHPCE